MTYTVAIIDRLHSVALAIGAAHTLYIATKTSASCQNLQDTVNTYEGEIQL